MGTTLTKDEFRRVLGHWATGVSIVTTLDSQGQPYGLTVNSFTSVSLEPPLVLICIDKNVGGHEYFSVGGYFAVNILTESQEELSRKFATKGIDRFAGVSYHESAMRMPILDDTLGYLECSIVAAYEGGDHTIFLGEVQAAGTTEGKYPLIFYRGKYTGIRY